MILWRGRDRVWRVRADRSGIRVIDERSERKRLDDVEQIRAWPRRRGVPADRQQMLTIAVKMDGEAHQGGRLVLGAGRLY